jgi:hypothetical protein
MLIEGSPLYSPPINNISMLMDGKMGKFSLECSRSVMGINNGFFTTLEQMKYIHIVFLEALSMVKKFL